MEKERVIFRREYNPYYKTWGYLAIFPDDLARPGMINATPFYYDNKGNAIFECYGEISKEYMYKKKIIHKNDFIIPKLKEVLERYYNTELIVCEKI